MTKVKVVNRQEIDGTEYERGQVAEFSDGRARDLISRGKAVEATAEDEALAAAQREAAADAEVDKPAPATADPETPQAPPEDTPKKASTPRAVKKPATGEKEAADV